MLISQSFTRLTEKWFTFQGEELASPKTTIEVTKYNPLKSDYHPINDAGWEKGKRVPYMALARTLELVWWMTFFNLDLPSEMLILSIIDWRNKFQAENDRNSCQLFSKCFSPFTRWFTLLSLFVLEPTCTSICGYVVFFFIIVT